MTTHACCTPARGAAGAAGADAAAQPAPRAAPTVAGAPDRAALCPIPAGSFTMGSDAADAVAEDGEGPARRVSLDAFEIAPAAVTNREFGDFVRATRHVTDAERFGSSFVFYLQVAEAERARQRRTAPGLPWWLPVEHASWQRPYGPGSHVRDRPDDPVVHVSWHDCQAYCAWSGTRLPTEAEWERAARGGVEGRAFPWGDALDAGGTRHCNVWRGAFPDRPADGWRPGTVPVRAFEPNGFGLFNVCGNVWEWCADWFSPDYHRATAAHDPRFETPTGRRAARGGSFLCHVSYCNRYRVAARGSNTPDSAASNLGFRVAR